MLNHVPTTLKDIMWHSIPRVKHGIPVFSKCHSVSSNRISIPYCSLSAFFTISVIAASASPLARMYPAIAIVFKSPCKYTPLASTFATLTCG